MEEVRTFLKCFLSAHAISPLSRVKTAAAAAAFIFTTHACLSFLSNPSPYTFLRAAAEQQGVANLALYTKKSESWRVFPLVFFLQSSTFPYLAGTPWRWRLSVGRGRSNGPAVRSPCPGWLRSGPSAPWNGRTCRGTSRSSSRPGNSFPRPGRWPPPIGPASSPGRCIGGVPGADYPHDFFFVSFSLDGPSGGSRNRPGTSRGGSRTSSRSRGPRGWGRSTDPP